MLDKYGGVEDIKHGAAKSTVDFWVHQGDKRKLQDSTAGCIRRN
jgi:hypothetical protein